MKHKGIYILIAVFIILYLQVKSQSYIVVGDTISNYITYNNIKDTTLPFIAKNSFSADLDIDYDGINDVRFYRAHASSPAYGQTNYEVYSLYSVQFIRTLTNLTNCDSLVPGDSINSNSNWNANFNYGNLYYSFSSPPPPWGLGNSKSGVCTKNNTYIGFRKFNNTDTIYGWFLLDLQGLSYTIKSYSINKNMNVTRLIENNENKQLIVYPNPASSKLMLELTSMNVLDNNSSVFLRNELGRTVSTIKLNNEKHYEIDVSKLPNGIYFIFVQTDAGYLKKKIIVCR